MKNLSPYLSSGPSSRNAVPCHVKEDSRRYRSWNCSRTGGVTAPRVVDERGGAEEPAGSEDDATAVPRPRLLRLAIILQKQREQKQSREQEVSVKKE